MNFAIILIVAMIVLLAVVLDGVRDRVECLEKGHACPVSELAP